MKTPAFLRPSFSRHPSSSGFSCGVSQDGLVQHVTTLALATLRCRGRSEREWECVRRNDNELPAETQTLRCHNSAPHATQTLWPRLNRSSQQGEHICMKIPTFLRPSFSWHQSSSGFSCGAPRDQRVQHITTLARAKTHITINGHWWNP